MWTFKKNWLFTDWLRLLYEAVENTSTVDILIFIFHIHFTREEMSELQHLLFVKNLNSVMWFFIPLLTDIVSNIFSLRCDLISRHHQTVFIFASSIYNEMHYHDECDLTVIIPTPYCLNNNISNTRRVQRSTQHNTAYPDLLMFCLCSLFVTSRAKMIIDFCMKPCT